MRLCAALCGVWVFDDLRASYSDPLLILQRVESVLVDLLAAAVWRVSK